MDRGEAKAQRVDPYRNFKFRVKLAGRYVAGVRKVGALEEPTGVVGRRGGDPSGARKKPGRSEYEPVTLEQGVTHDPEFARWVGAGVDPGSGRRAQASPVDVREDVVIEAYDEAGRLAQAYRIFRCTVSEVRAGAEGDPKSTAVKFGSIKLENEGLERVDVRESGESTTT